MNILLLLCLIVRVYSYSMIPISRKDAILTLSSLTFLNYEKDYLTTNKPIVVIGGCGYTGSDCVRTLVNEKRKNIRVVSRNPFALENISYPGLIDYKYGDITIPSSLPPVLQDAQAIIFSVNSKKRLKNENQDLQTPTDVNYLGLINVAKTCIKYEIPKLIVISASCSNCLTKDGLHDKFDKSCGLKCENCVSKSDGEKALRKLYSNVKQSYTIIKPGVLTYGEKRGVNEIEICQDNTKSGMISRLDLADICINSIENKNTDKTTFSCYYRDTIQPNDVKKSLEICTGLNKTIEECFFGSYFKNSKPKNLEDAMKAPIKDTLFATGNEYSGNTYKELFKNLKKDKIIDFNLNDINFEII